MLELKNISKHYGSILALNTINLSIPPGKTTIFLGPSGCGKSTLIRIMNGLIQADSGGSVYFEGAQLTPENALQLRRKMGYVIQEGGLFPHRTAYQNIALMANYLGWPKKLIHQRIMELTQLTQFPAAGLERFPAQLSGGQRQRVSLMRALALDPDLLLLDEPLGALDPMIRFELQAELKQIFQTLGKTVVMVTHDIGEASFLGDLIVLLRNGTIVQQGVLKDLVHNPADPFVTQFINAQRNPIDW
ncbi:MAG: ATP-binding cassette domain-containing protein [Pseudomonadota bacterium]|nr:ATP-binding cassette domain-containing protein [Pseudomonadota bacterium]